MMHSRTNRCLVALLGCLFVAPFLRAQTNAPAVINVAGTFNEWSATNAAFAMSVTQDGTYELQQFFRAGKYKFKFVFDGGWARNWGEGPGGKLLQSGKDLSLVIPKHGAYQISLDLKERTWKLDELRLEVPHPVVNVTGPVEVGVAITLDASESVARSDFEISRYKFSQDTNDTIKAGLLHADGTLPQATVILPKEGTYHFVVRVNDGVPGIPETITLKALTSYQLLGDWTQKTPLAPETFLERKGTTTFERILKSTNASEQALILVKNHDPAAVATNLTVSITQTNAQFWRVRFDERSGLLQCAPEQLTEFRYRPKDDKILWERVKVNSVNLAGSFSGWSPTGTPMLLQDDGSFVAYVKLDEGLYQYKFVVNGDIWRPDSKADPDLRTPDGHEGFNSGIFIGEQGKDFGPPVPRRINMDAIRHKPEQAAYLSAVTSEDVQLRLRTLHGDVDKAAVVVLGERERTFPLHKEEARAGFDWWSAMVPVAAPGKPLDYFFTLAKGDGEWKLGEPPFSVIVTNRLATPEWAKHVVWYQIFPERFRNGTSENDPPHTIPWRWDWYKFTAWEIPNETKTFAGDWYSRRFGGDLQGVIEELPYFHELGVTALYFCPVFECSSSHGYDTVDYRHINHFFGFKESLPTNETLETSTWQWTASDRLFLEFIQKAHAQGMKVIVDGVFNHMGRESFAMRDVLSNGVNSACADWFDIQDWGPPVKYKSWDGGGSLPNFRKDDEKGYASDSAKKYIFDITRRWMAPEGNPTNGIDGWRLDVAEDVPRPFWVEWRKLVKGINPQAYLTGEAWGEVPKHLRGDEWDATMNYPFAVRCIRYFVDHKRKISASEFDRQLKQLLTTYSMSVDLAMQNLYDSHDTDRLVSMIANPDRDYDGCNRPQDGCPYNGAKPGPEAYRVLKLMATFQMTFLGAPMIWYGDEAGMFGADDPTDRKPMLWKDLQPYNNPQDTVMDDVWNHYVKLIAIRNTFPALRTGAYQAFLTDDANDLFGFTRTRGNQVVAVILNGSTQDFTGEIKVPFADETQLVDVLNGAVEIRDLPMKSLGFPEATEGAMIRGIQINPNGGALTVQRGRIRMRLPGKGAMVLVKR